MQLGELRNLRGSGFYAVPAYPVDVEDGSSRTRGLGWVCELRKEWCYHDAATLAVSIVAVACQGIVLGRIFFRRMQGKSGPHTPIGRLLEYLVTVLCSIDLLYNTPDIFFSLDLQAPPLYYEIKYNYPRDYVRRLMFYELFRECFGILILQWHATIAHAMYSWVCLKKSAARLRKARLPLQIFLAFGLTGIRYVLWSYGGQPGLTASIYIYHAGAVPLCLLLMMFYYCRTAYTLYKAGESPAMPPEPLHARADSESTISSRPCPPLSTSSYRVSRVGAPRHYPLMRRGQRSAAYRGKLHMTVSYRGAGSMLTGDSSSSRRSSRTLYNRLVDALYVSLGLRPPRAAFGPPHGVSEQNSDDCARAAAASVCEVGSVGGSWDSKVNDDGDDAGDVKEEQQQGGDAGGEGLGDDGQSDRVTSSRWRRVAVNGRRQVRRGSSGGLGQSRDAFNRHMSIVQRLMRISLAVFVMWSMGNGFDLAVWLDFLVNRVRLSSFVYVARLIFIRVVGIIDAVVLGGLCTRNPTPESGTANSQARSSALPQRHNTAAHHVDGGRAGRGASVEGSDEGECGDGAKGEPTPNGRSRLGFPLLYSVAYSGDSGLPHQYSDLVRRQRMVRPGMARIFASTWNTGGVSPADLEASLGPLLPLWIPNAYDVYVIGVQECECFKELRDLVQKYLGGPEVYTAFHRDLGDVHLIHGVIGVLVLARTEDVESGAFEIKRGSVTTVAAGVNLGPMGSAPNKGMVGMSARYYDTSLALLSAHFAADLHGRNRSARRNQDACKTLRQLSLLGDSEEFDVHHQHDHTILVGDLNYRMGSSPDEVLSHVATAARLCPRSLTPSHATMHPTSPIRVSQLHAGVFSRGGGGDCVGELGGHIVQRDSGKNHCEGPEVVESMRHEVVRPREGSMLMAAGGSPDPILSGGALSSRRTGLTNDDAEQRRQAWSWVPRLDGLSQSMADHLVFYSFHEEPILFPPSYRWKRGGDPGDYTDPQYLTLHAYTTSVLEPPGVSTTDASASDTGRRSVSLHTGGRRSSTSSRRMMSCSYSGGEGPNGPWWLGGSSASDGTGESGVSMSWRWPRAQTYTPDGSARESGGGGGGALGAPSHRRTQSAMHADTKTWSHVDPSSMRTPSYTDRVLIHSLTGCTRRLKWLSYDMVDAVRLSDHRPVAATFELQVDKAIRGFTEVAVGSSTADPRQDIARHATSPPQPRPPTSSPPPPPLPASVPCNHTTPSTISGNLVTFTIVLDNPRVDGLGAALRWTHRAPKELTILFPLISEDPLYAQRRTEALNTVLLGSQSSATKLAYPPTLHDDDGDCQGMSAAAATEPPPTDAAAAASTHTQTHMVANTTHTHQTLQQAHAHMTHVQVQQPRSACRHVNWKSFPVRHRAVGSLRFSQHILVKVNDGNGQALGSAVLMIKHFVGGESKRARVGLSSGGLLRGYLSIDVRVKWKHSEHSGA